MKNLRLGPGQIFLFGDEENTILTEVLAEDILTEAGEEILQEV